MGVESGASRQGRGQSPEGGLSWVAEEHTSEALGQGGAPPSLLTASGAVGARGAAGGVLALSSYAPFQILPWGPVRSSLPPLTPNSQPVSQVWKLLLVRLLSSDLGQATCKMGVW